MENEDGWQIFNLTGILGKFASSTRISKNSDWTPIFFLMNQGKGLNWDLFANQYLFQKNKSWPMLKDRAKWNTLPHFNSLILSFHTWNISKKCPSQIYKQWKSDWDTSWEFFMYDNSELSCWNSLFLQWQSMGNDLFFWNKYWFTNRSQFGPLHWYSIMKYFSFLDLELPCDWLGDHLIVLRRHLATGLWGSGGRHVFVDTISLSTTNLSLSFEHQVQSYC